MKVLLKRGLVLDAIHYDANPKGTEVPNEVGGVPVMTKDEWKKLDDPSKGVPLPHDAKILDEAANPPTPPAPPAAQALSSMTRSDAEALDVKPKTKK